MAVAFDKENSVSFVFGTADAENSIIRTPFRVGVSDSTRLHGYRYRIEAPGKERSALPMLCLPSDLGNALEFERFARQILADDSGPRDVYTLSLRGRGQSDGSDIASYSPLIAAEDVISVCDALNLHEVAMLTNGGSALVALLAAPKRPSLVQSLILNDGAPERDSVGIARLHSLTKSQPPARDLDSAIERETALLGTMFPAFGEPDWQERVSVGWNPEDDKPFHDLALSDYFDALSYEERQPTLWKEFRILAQRPIMALRGEHSPLITAEIVAKMREHAPALLERVVPGQGHVPLLTKDSLASEIAAFLHA